MAKYSALAARALNTITRKGGSGTLTRETVTVDAVAQTRATTTADTAIKAVATKVNVRRAEQLLGSLVDRNLGQILVGCYGLTTLPQINDKVTWGGHVWRIFGVDNIDPAGDEIIVADVYLER